MPPWPPLRVVGIDDIPRPVAAPAALVRTRSTRPTWALLWAVGLLVVVAQAIEQAIDAYYG